MTSESTLTLKELADIYSIPYETLRSKAGDDRWSYLRAEYQTKNQIAIREARTVALVKEAVSFDDVSLKAAKLGQTLIVGRLGQIAALFQAQGISFERALEKARNGLPLDPSETRSSINYKELVELANALDRFQNVGRKALGTDVEKIDINSSVGVTRVDVHIGDELAKPDVDRMASTIEAMRRAGLHSLLGEQLALPEVAEEVVDGEIIEDAEEGEEEAQEDSGQGTEETGVSPVLEGQVIG